MTKYAIKIGEIHLRSDEPITDEQRLRAVRQLLKHDRASFITTDGLEVVDIVVNRR